NAPCGVGQSTPGISDSIDTILRRRASKTLRISATASSGPEIAARAACWATLDTLPHRCDWNDVAALMTSCGPWIQPTRHPVIEYVLATPLSTRVVSASSGTALVIAVASTPS